jgi:hypothetical protein
MSRASTMAAAQAGRPLAPPAQQRRWADSLLDWAFTGFNSLRVFAYLPTLWAIHTSAGSGQHSLWTWCIWFAANLTMALWLARRDGWRLSFAAVVNGANAVMCAAGVALIVWYRL